MVVTDYKDITLASEVMAMGCIVTSQPPRVDADPRKLFPLLLSTLALASGHALSPLGLHVSTIAFKVWCMSCCQNPCSQAGMAIGERGIKVGEGGDIDHIFAARGISVALVVQLLEEGLAHRGSEVLV